MTRENRIKEYVFDTFTVVGSVPTNQYTHQANVSTGLNGEILKICVCGISSPGSLWIAESGTNIELWRTNALTSGLVPFNSYPIIYGVDKTNVTGSPQAFTNMVTNTTLYLAGSGFTSGTGTVFGPVTIYYR
jgi:hypothetical protein